MIRRIVLVILTAAVLTLPVCAAGLEDAFGIPELKASAPEAADILGELNPARPDPDDALARLGNYIRTKAADTIREILRPLAAIAAVCILGGIGESMAEEGGAAAAAAAFGSCLAISVIGIEDVHSVLALGSSTMTALLDFSRVLLPTLAAAAAASGSVGAAGAAYAASALFSDLLLSAAEGILLPMICGFAAVSAAAGILGDARLEGAVRFLRWCTKTGMKILVFTYTAYLTLTGVLSAAADAAAVKTAKTVLSAALPVVGKLMADASEALVAGAGLLKSAVGVYGMLVCLAIVILPVLRLGLRCLLFKGAAAVCAGIAGPRQAKLIGNLADAYGMLFGLIGSAAAVEFLSIISLVRTVTL